MIGLEERQGLYLDPLYGTVLLALLAAGTCALALVVFRRRRFPHKPAWLAFLLYALAIGIYPPLREWHGQGSPLAFGLWGVPIGLVLASMLTLGRKPSHPTATEEAR